MQELLVFPGILKTVVRKRVQVAASNFSGREEIEGVTYLFPLPETLENTTTIFRLGYFKVQVLLLQHTLAMVHKHKRHVIALGSGIGTAFRLAVH